MQDYGQPKAIRLRIKGAVLAACLYCHDMVQTERKTDLIGVGLAEDVLDGLVDCLGRELSVS